MTFSANAWSLTLRTEKITFCPGSRTRRFKTSDEMKGTLEPSAPSIIPNPWASIFFTIPVILSVLPVQPCSRSASRSGIGRARDFSIQGSFPLAASPGTPFAVRVFTQFWIVRERIRSFYFPFRTIEPTVELFGEPCDAIPKRIIDVQGITYAEITGFCRLTAQCVVRTYLIA